MASIVPHIFCFAAESTREMSRDVGTRDGGRVETSELGRGMGNPTCRAFEGTDAYAIGAETDFPSVGSVCASRLDYMTAVVDTEKRETFDGLPDVVTGNAFHLDVTKTDGVLSYDHTTKRVTVVACFGGTAVASMSCHITDKVCEVMCEHSVCERDSAGTV